MPSVRQISRRIRSVENTAKITKAMSMIAASKMRRAQEAALQGRPYAEHMRTLLANLAAQPSNEDNVHPLLARRDLKTLGLVVITPDRGLTGGLNGNINRAVGEFISKQESDVAIEAVSLGRKGRDFMVRARQNLVADFSDIEDRPSLLDITPAARILLTKFEAGEIDAAYVAYAKFVSTTVQEPVVVPLLPVTPSTLEYSQKVGYIYEPGAAEVIDHLLPRYVEMQVYAALLEGIASEQSARMVAMRNATDSANTMVDDLTLEMNKARQETITKELLDIVGGVAAVDA